MPPGDRILRWLAELWMLFPTEAQYRDWFQHAGFEDVELDPVAPDWYRDPRSRYAVAVSGRKPAAGPVTARAARRGRGRRRRRWTGGAALTFAGRFVLGSLAGLVFVPVGAILSLRRRR